MSSRKYTKDDAYRIMRARLTKHGPAHVHHESYEHFLNDRIPACLSEHAPITVVRNDIRHVVDVCNVRFGLPSFEGRVIHPHECRLRRINYQIPMFITAQYLKYDKDGNLVHEVIFRDKPFDTIPCMVGSSFCTSRSDPERSVEDEGDCGGYFITPGAEKVVVGQETPRTNYPFVTDDGGDNLKCELRSFNENRHRSTSTLYITLQTTRTSSSLKERRTITPRISVTIPFVKNTLAASLMFKLLNVGTIEEMLDYIVCEETDPDWFKYQALQVLLYDLNDVVLPREAAVSQLVHDRGTAYTSAKKRKQEEEELANVAPAKRRKIKEAQEKERTERQMEGLINTEFLPHQGYSPEDIKAKAVQLGLAIRKLLRVYYGLQDQDDRDHYMHRRVSFESTLMANLFRSNYNMWRRRMAAQMRQSLESGAAFLNVKNLLHASIGNNLTTALSTGNFSMQRGPNNMDGVGQPLSRIEPSAPQSHLTRVNNPVNRDGRAIKPKLLDSSWFGIIDPWETSEGPACGLARNIVPMAGVRVGYSTDTLTTAVVMTGYINTDNKNMPLGKMVDKCPVFISGVIIGTCELKDATKLMTLLRKLRASQDLPYDVSIYRTVGRWKTIDNGEIHINGDAGSYWWPLIRADRFHELVDVLDSTIGEDNLWTKLIGMGIIEIINKDEEVSEVRVATTHRDFYSHPKGTFTHVVIHESQICSVFTGRNPMPEFLQSPRVTYAVVMGKQQLGRKLTSMSHRADTTAHYLWYPEKPLVTTFMESQTNTHGVASGENIVVMIICNGGYNVEDGLIMNRASVERGLFRSTVVKSVRDVVRGSNRAPGRTGNDEVEKLGMPENDCRSKLNADYSAIDPETGTVRPFTHVGAKHVLIAKHAVITQKEKGISPETGQEIDVITTKTRDRSTITKAREPSIVDEVIMSTTEKGETSTRVRTRSMRIPEEGDKCACLTPDHDVLTDKGWIPIAQVKLTDKVASLNRNTLEVEYKHPNYVHTYPSYKAPIVYDVYYPGVISQQVTSDHRMPLWKDDSVTVNKTIWDVINNDAESIDTSHYVRSKIGVRQSTLPENLRYLHDEFFYYCGAVATASKIDISKDDNMMTLKVLNPRALMATLAVIGVKSTMGQKSNETLVYVFNTKKRIAIDRQLFIDMDMWVPKLNRNQSVSFLRGMMGMETLYGRHNISIRNDDIDMFMLVGINAGIAAWIDPVTKHACVDFEAGEAVIVDTTNIKRVPNKQNVHCLTIQDSGVFMVRRHGIASWTGNSRYGQKGTINAMYNPEDMPYSLETGITPDLLFNPHGLPSRMTVSHLMEFVMGKTAALSGEFKDGTAFTLSEEHRDFDNPDSVLEHIMKELEELGFNGDGTETVVDGRTGRVMECKVFTGTMTYAKLKHMVKDKFHARSRGPVQLQTRQPTEGRGREGGNRFGEMERDSLLAHGATAFLQERLLHSSDAITVPVCSKCGQIAQNPRRKGHKKSTLMTMYSNKPFCRICLTHEGINDVVMPAAYRLSVQHNEAMHLNVNLGTE